MDYKEIRKKPNFLYLYFLEKGGKRVNEPEFNGKLDHWLMMKGQVPMIGRKLLEKHLDNKHG